MEIFDPADALRRAGGDEALLKERCAAFLRSAPSRIGDLDRALEERRVEDLVRLASELQAAAAEIGAQGTSHLASQMLEAAGEKADWAAITSLLTKLDMEMSWLARVLDDRVCSGNL